MASGYSASPFMSSMPSYASQQYYATSTSTATSPWANLGPYNTFGGQTTEGPTFQVKTQQPERKRTMLDHVKGYVEKHKDMLFTLLLVILVDHFLFNGALRERIKSAIEGMLSKAENALKAKEN